MERRAIVIHGIVQGVGIRPFVYNLAVRLKLGGFVKNQTGSVVIEVEGETAALEHFLIDLSGQAPPLSQIDDVTWKRLPPQGEFLFRIESSDNEKTKSSPIYLSPDVATCADCRAELFNPADRRYRYPFLNCTNCGPRLTIVQGVPYDRQRTTMAAFVLCRACQAEYDNPLDRRFHAQPIACPACGPKLQCRTATGEPMVTEDVLGCFLTAMQAGKIGALKGLGGYHLVCDARNTATVTELRRRKHRDEKPFALMVADITAVEFLCEVEGAERALLVSPRCPIVLLRKRTPSIIADAVAPANPYLGVMLPATPLHHLLAVAADGMPLVMTSGNRADEPIAYRDDDALQRLADIADLFLLHDRPIHVRCDDSVTRIVDGQELPLRRSRGYAPRPIALPLECRQPILAVGGQLKVTFALGRDRQAFLSHHMGDMDHFASYQAFVKDVALYEELFAVTPACLVHDLHPDYLTTRYVQDRAVRMGTTVLSVQHHHAHMASCMAEHGLVEPVIGVTFDGTGYGLDGAVWGGEFLVGDYRKFRRAAHLRYVGMPGGERAIRGPWRMALAHLRDAGATSSGLSARILPRERRLIEQMLEQGINTPWTSSAGRLFDAAAALLGLRDEVRYEGQAAIELERLATPVSPDGSYPFEITETHSEPMLLDTRPLIRALIEEANRGIDPARLARRFHSTLVEMIAAVCERVRTTTGISAAVLSGGVFLNALLTCETTARLKGAGFRVYRHRLVPPNDGGLSLGQLAIAAQQLLDSQTTKPVQNSHGVFDLGLNAR